MRKLQLIEGGRVTRENTRRSVHAMVVEHCRGLRSAARHHGLSDNEALALIVEQERIEAQKREKKAFLAGRASLWKVAA